MARTPAEDAAKLAAGLQALARRLRNAEVGEVGEAVFTNGDLDRIVENRLARELKKRGGDAERKRDALEAGVEALRRELLAESQTREDRF